MFFSCFQEGRTIVGSRTADIIQETKKLQSRRREINSGEPNQDSGTWQQNTAQVHMQASQEDQLKASRDVRWQLCNGVFLVHVVEDAKFYLQSHGISNLI